MITPAIPVKITSDINIIPPSDALQNLKPWFIRSWAMRNIKARITNKIFVESSGR